MARRSNLWTGQVLEKRELSPNMARILIEGPELASFPAKSIGGYVKLKLINDDGKPVTRSYTVRAADPGARTITLDFAIHGDGVAANWFEQAEQGDKIQFGGPGRVQLVADAADWYLVAGDMSALPAVCVNLERLPEDAKGYVLLEVIDDADQALEVVIPESIELIWVVNPNPGQSTILADTLKRLAWHGGKVSAWFAGEFGAMQAARKYLKFEKGLSKDELYLSSYWKHGTTDAGNKKAKRELQRRDLLRSFTQVFKQK